MHELSDILNLVGIILEIIGFTILLKQFKEWSFEKFNLGNNKSRRYNGYYDKLRKTSDEKSMKMEKIIDHFNKSESNLNSERQKISKFVEIMGIPLVITGLIFQGLSVIFHN